MPCFYTLEYFMTLCTFLLPYLLFDVFGRKFDRKIAKIKNYKNLKL